MRENGGFTLIELLIVITIIGILVGFSAINLVSVRQRGRDAQRKADLRAIQSAFELYRADQRSYPDSLPGCGLPLTGGSPTRTHLSARPCDPLPAPQAPYLYSPNGSPVQSYTLRACLENANDAESDTKQGGPDTCSGPTVSYTMSNP